MELERNESSKLVLKEIKKIAGKLPVIFMGELNGGNETEWYKAIANSGLLKDTFKPAKYPLGNNPLFKILGN